MKRMKLWVGLMIGLGLLLLIGCSRINPVDSGTGEFSLPNSLPPNNIYPYQYPPEANLPPPGYRFVCVVNPQARATDDFWTWTYMTHQTGGWLWLMGSNVHITPNGLPYNSWIGMSRESFDEPWIEYEPHGLVFSSTQSARISYAGCDLPPNIPPGQLTVWYWHEEIGQYELIGGLNNIAQQYITFPIHHFSRYVVAVPAQ